MTQPNRPTASFSRKTRRQFLQGAGAALSAAALASCRGSYSNVQGGAGGGDTLRIYTWSNYIDDELLSQFQEQTGFRAIADVFDSNETMLAKVQAGGGNEYSVIYPSDYMVEQMKELNLLAELDKSKITGAENLLPQFQDPPYDPGNQFSLPAVWGTTGLVYNRTQLNPSPQDWDYLWDNQSKLARRVTLFNDVREVMGAALKSLGYSYNSTNPKELEAAFRRLQKLKPAIANFTTDGWRDQMLTGDLAIAMAYSSDALQVSEESADIQYLIPASGSSLWTDTMVIPAAAPNPDAGYAWINFMLEPDVLARAAERLRFATANQAAIDLLPNALKSNPNLYPSQAALQKCERISPVGNATELYDQYWTQLTSL
ncbi:polyamine ABC transporter substrate-binding protein [Thermoleptolyngbya sp.]